MIVRQEKWYNPRHGKSFQLSSVLLSRFLSGQSNVTLSVSQKKLLIALARERTDEFGDAYRRRYALGVSSTVNSAKTKLMEDGLIERSDGQYVVADPFFAQFLRMA